ncbi:hypothetical protein C1646_757220 [Rhizophagus diaphanus]|nr:hypothetical protein C1646_757220 [Rhizophagus diaphanus] [Rhizophagus sp. MUCL 43196]
MSLDKFKRYNVLLRISNWTTKHKKKNRFASEGATNSSKKAEIRENINTEEHSNAEKLEKAKYNKK